MLGCWEGFCQRKGVWCQTIRTLCVRAREGCGRGRSMLVMPDPPQGRCHCWCSAYLESAFGSPRRSQQGPDKGRQSLLCNVPASVRLTALECSTLRSYLFPPAIAVGRERHWTEISTFFFFFFFFAKFSKVLWAWRYVRGRCPESHRLLGV